jgi:hypothetical protein
MIATPTIAMRKFVTTYLRMNGRSDRPSSPRDHEETPALIHLRAAKGTIGRDDAVHRMAIMLNLGQGALLNGQLAPIATIVDRRR